MAQGWSGDRSHSGWNEFYFEREVHGFGSGWSDFGALLGAREQCVAVSWSWSGGDINGGDGGDHAVREATACGGAVESCRCVVGESGKYADVDGECRCGSGVDVPVAQRFGADQGGDSGHVQRGDERRGSGGCVRCGGDESCGFKSV